VKFPLFLPIPLSLHLHLATLSRCQLILSTTVVLLLGQMIKPPLSLIPYLAVQILGELLGYTPLLRRHPTLIQVSF
jgi:hypothetical protein